MLNSQEVVIYSDGGSHGNPGAGAWAFVIKFDDKQISGSGSEKWTTNNKMELLAVINALKSLSGLQITQNPISIFTDSQYVKNGITVWIHNWKKNGWRTASKGEVKNKELWVELDTLVANYNITFNWVKGHSGNELNELCDSLVQEAIKKIE